MKEISNVNMAHGVEVTDKGQVGGQAPVDQLFPVLSPKGEVNHPLHGWYPKDLQILMRLAQDWCAGG